MNSEYVLAKYLRISEDDGQYGDSQSIEGQRALLDDFISCHPELRVARTLEFCDDGHSGTNFNRPGVKSLLEQAKSGKINAIIVKDFSRFGRSYIDVGDYLEQIFPFLHVRFLSVNDGFDSDRQDCSAGDVGVAFKSLCNDYYSKDLSRKIRAGVNTLRQTGKYLSPYAVYGYKKSISDQYRLEIDETAAAVVRRIFELRLDGETLVGIARALNSDGILTPMVYKRENGVKRGWNTHSANNVWNDTIVRGILKDVRYIGAVVQGKSKSDVVGSGKSRSLPMEQWHITYEQHDPIIEKNIFDEVQLKNKKHKYVRKISSADSNPLAKKVRCGGCGYGLTRSLAKNPLYYCKQRNFTGSEACLSERVDTSVVESVLISALKKLFDGIRIEEDKRREYADNLAAPSVALLKEIQALQRQTTALENEKLLLYTRYSDGKFDKNGYMSLRDETDNKLAALSDQISALERKRVDIAELPANNIHENMKGLHFDGRLTHEIVDTLIDSVIIHSADRIEVKWKFTDADIVSAIP